MELPTTEEIIASVEAFLARHAMAPSRFGRDATGDQNLLADLRKGASPSLARLHRMREFMEAKDAELAGADHDASDTTARPALSPGKSDDVTAQAVPA